MGTKTKTKWSIIQKLYKDKNTIIKNPTKINKNNKPKDKIKIKCKYNKQTYMKTKKNGKTIQSEYYNFSYESKEFVTKFNLKNKTQNYKYYNCFKRSIDCQGKALFDIEKEEFKVYNQ